MCRLSILREGCRQIYFIKSTPDLCLWPLCLHPPPPPTPQSRNSSKFIPQIISPLPTFPPPTPSTWAQRYILIPAKSSHNIMCCRALLYSPQHPVLDLESDSRQKKIKNQKVYFGKRVKLTTNLHRCFLKGRLTRDFRHQIFFINQCPPGP